MLKMNNYWLLAFVWLGLIYSTLYIVRPICSFLKENTPFSLLINLLLGLAFAGMTAVILKAVRKPGSYARLALALSVYTASLFVIAHPEEKLHLVEYGLLAFFLFRALTQDGARQPYLQAWVLASIAGWLDEGIQHILPNRYYQNTDVLLNAFSAGMGLVMVHILDRDQGKAKLAN